MNRVVISGNLVRDPEVRYFDGGKAVTNFTIAINDVRKDGKEFVSYIRCAAWGEAGIKLADTARKGTGLLIEGTLNQRRWTDREGRKRDDVSVTVFRFYPTARAVRQAPSPTEDDLPW